VGQRSGAGWPADPPVPPVPPEDEVGAEPLLPESPVLPPPELLLELLPEGPDDPGDWLVLPGNPSLPDDPPLPDEPGLPDEPEGGDDEGGWGGEEEVDSLVMAHPDRTSTPASAQATRDPEGCSRIWLDSGCGGR
jgi:hypothetical protein